MTRETRAKGARRWEPEQGIAFAILPGGLDLIDPLPSYEHLAVTAAIPQSLLLELEIRNKASCSDAPSFDGSVSQSTRLDAALNDKALD